MENFVFYYGFIITVPILLFSSTEKGSVCAFLKLCLTAYSYKLCSGQKTQKFVYILFRIFFPQVNKLNFKSSFKFFNLRAFLILFLIYKEITILQLKCWLFMLKLAIILVDNLTHNLTIVASLISYAVAEVKSLKKN